MEHLFDVENLIILCTRVGGGGEMVERGREILF